MFAPPIEASGLRVRFGAFEALRGLDLAVEGPGVHGFLGVNGAGKSTTMRALMGFVPASGGRVSVFGAPPGALSSRRRIGYLPQESAAYDWMTGEEALRFEAELLGLDTREARAAGERLGLGTALVRRVGGYSGGMRQRLGLARALLGAPDLLLLDEPVAALDPVGRAEVLDLLAELGERCTVLMSSHVLSDIERIASHVTVVHEGRVVVSGPLGALLERHARPTIELEVEGDVASLRAALASASWVHRIEDGPPLRVEVVDADAARRALPQLVVGGGWGLVRLEEVAPTLEETFLHLVAS